MLRVNVYPFKDKVLYKIYTYIFAEERSEGIRGSVRKLSRVAVASTISRTLFLPPLGRFHPNTANNYYSPENSYIDQVFTRAEGSMYGNDLVDVQ